MKKRQIPDNQDGLWRVYFGNRKYHRYCQSQLNASWCRQEALCGKVSKTGNGAYSLLGLTAHRLICRKCEAVMKETK